MVRKVLIVDDDKEMLVSLKDGLEKYNETFTVLTSEDGEAAVSQLDKTPISLVVTDLKMPRMDGFALLAYIMERYPDIPVIIMTGYSTPEMERLAKEGGAVGYIEKPFMIEDLARKIMGTMRRESDGGTLHGISSGMFLQLIEMEGKTCTIRLMDKLSGRQGVLFFREGELLNARVNGKQGTAAAYEIFSWDEVTLSIQNVCSQKDKKIEGDLQAILLEAMRLKDEAGHAEGPEYEAVDEVEVEEVPEVAKPAAPDPVEDIKARLLREVGEKSGVEDIYKDNRWQDFLAKIGKLGSLFGAGDLRLSYLDTGASNGYILISEKDVVVLSVSPKCPRDRIIKALGG